ncbi:hypothetical protein KHQ81_07385 [Mycoplasmatota bacterium]|nr:hypothetical protein KHQ81_07385 [Mycoplasmatota bacterium]
MKVREYNKDSKVYYSANDRFVKKINDDIYEVYHISNIEDGYVLNVTAINLSDNLDINHYLKNCGLKYIEEENKIVQRHDENKVVSSDNELVKYILADKLIKSGAFSNVNQFEFENAKDLNEIILEHNIPHRFNNATLHSL